MKLFVPQDNETTVIGVMGIVLFATLIVLGVVSMSAAGLLLAGFSLLVGVLTLILTKKTGKSGLYIDDEKLVFKLLKAKKYSLNDIKGIIVLTYQVQAHHGFARLWRINTAEYKILYLKNVLAEFYTFDKGHQDFMDLYGNHILFHTVYDENVIEYLKSKNIPIISRVNKTDK